MTGLVCIGLMEMASAVGKASDSLNGHSPRGGQANTLSSRVQRRGDTEGISMQQVQPHQWRKYGFGGPPEPWEHGAQRDLDRLATSYYLEVLNSYRAIVAAGPDAATRSRIDELFATAERHKHEVDFTLRHWATPVERARVEDRVGSLMRIGIRLRDLRDTTPSEPMSAA
jgi:hypothetical protein